MSGEDELRRARVYARRRLGRSALALRDFVRLPSVSSEPERAREVRRCAEWLGLTLRRIGMQRVQIIETAGHPVVYSHWRGAAEAPTVLIYGHYDVQPAHESDGWSQPPFDARVRDDKLCGRGSSDDKGQVLAYIAALEAYLATSRALPVNVKCLFEGEEEIGSPHLESFLERHRAALGADVVVLSDTPMRGPGAPALIQSLRGALGLELRARGASKEVHSGNFGGAIPNPVQALCQLISGLFDAQGRIAIPGFYRRVRPVADDERFRMAVLGPSDQEILAHAGTRVGVGEPGFSAYERTTVRPALSVTGIAGGHARSHGKASIPTQARAHLDCRLVPDQSTLEIEQLFRHHLRCITPAGIELSVRTRIRCDPVAVERCHPAARVASQAYRRAFGAPAVFLRRGGSIPPVAMLQRLFGTPAVLMGFGLPEDNIHGQDECFGLSRLARAIDTCILFLAGARALNEGGALARGARQVALPPAAATGLNR
jgi:acetylornithine deacetylase/succinyl-diaminopimelate desuccinylase-like protein